MFYSIPNLGATAVTPMEKPWECSLRMPPECGPDKAARQLWQNNFATKHAFISGVEGMTASVRVSYSQSNVPHKIHAFIADFDAKVIDAELDKLRADPPSEFLPAWFVRTGSGNGRLIWLIDAPVLVASEAQVKEFLLLVGKTKLKLDCWLAAWDKDAFCSIVQYYELGTEWVPMFPDAVLSQAMVNLWLYESSKRVKLDDGYGSGYTIPMDLIKEEVDKRYDKNIWKGPFVEGARGVRFWDPDAKDETGAVIMKQGVMAFSGEQAFMPWRVLLGEAFVARFEADKVGNFREKVAWDGKEFWVQDEEEWLSENKGDFQQRLEVAGFSSSTPKGATCSEIDRLMVDLRKSRRVYRALPFIHFPPGILAYEERRYLNTSMAKCLQPAKDADCSKAEDALKYFPFVWRLLRTLFKDETPDANPWGQLSFFLAWLQRFYLGGLRMRPTQGQAVVLIGPQGAGKTLLARGVIAPLVGGMADATEYFTEDSQWTARIMEKALMVVDDSKPVATLRGSVMFSAALKKVVANSRMVYNEKFKQQGEVPHFGRPLILANFDTTSIQIIPDLDLSNRDKVMLFKSPDTGRLNFPDWDTVSRTLAQELPYFARFLQLWDAPAYTVSEDKRFGVKAFHHPVLYKEAMESGINEVLFEALNALVTSYRVAHKDQQYWEGDLMTLRKDLQLCYDQIQKEFPTQRQLSAAMKNLVLKSEYNVQFKYVHGLRLWRVWFDLRSPGVMPAQLQAPKIDIEALDKKDEEVVDE